MTDHALPPFRWAGSKRRLLKELRPRLPDDIAECRYVEPFLGGGALFFALAPKRAVLNDLNEDLIETYRALQQQPMLVLDILWPMLRHHDAALYALVRDLYNTVEDVESGLSGAESELDPRFFYHGLILRSAWFIYLMATCFNGLYRVNSSGHFNVPIGDKISFSHDKIDRASWVLRGGALDQRNVQIELSSKDFTEIAPKHGDFWYFDPPYAPASDTANFVSYTAKGFDTGDQMRLRDFCIHLSERGIRWMQTNSEAAHVFYVGLPVRIEQIMAPRTIAANGDRTDAAELIIRNY